jgi:hypothetical protein
VFYFSEKVYYSRRILLFAGIPIHSLVFIPPSKRVLISFIRRVVCNFVMTIINFFLELLRRCNRKCRVVDKKGIFGWYCSLNIEGNGCIFRKWEMLERRRSVYRGE